MSGRRSKRKGSSAEREFASIIGGTRIPLSGAVRGFEGDVKGLGMVWEVKRRRDDFRRIYGWLEGEGIDALAIRADRKPWLVVMEVETLMEKREELMSKIEELEERLDRVRELIYVMEQHGGVDPTTITQLWLAVDGELEENNDD